MKTNTRIIPLLVLCVFGSSILSNAQGKSKNDEKLNSEDDHPLAASLCGTVSLALGGGENPAEAIERDIIKAIENEEGITLKDGEKEKRVSEFLNKNSEKLMCGDIGDSSQIRDREHLFKRITGIGGYEIFD